MCVLQLILNSCPPCISGETERGFSDKCCSPTICLSMDAYPWDPLAIVAENSKGCLLFSKTASFSWLERFKSYSSRPNEFVLHSEDLFFIDKVNGNLIAGPSIEMPQSDYKLAWAQDVAEGMIFLVEKCVQEERSFMISGPKIVDKSSKKITNIVWKTVPGDHSLNTDWATSGPTVQINRKYLILSWSNCSVSLIQFTILDHSGTEVFPVVVCKDLPHFLNERPTLDSNYFVCGRGIFDLSQKGNCVFSTDPTQTKSHAISESYICLITFDGPRYSWSSTRPEVSRVEVWSKVLGKFEACIELGNSFRARGIVILVDRVALVLGAGQEFTQFQICAIDLKTKKFRIHSQEDICYPIERMFMKFRRVSSSTQLFTSRYQIWDELDFRITGLPAFFS